MAFECLNCGWCCKANPVFGFREGLWKEGLTEAQAIQVQKEQTKLAQNHGGCPMLIQEGDIFLCLVEKTLGKEAKPKSCRDVPYEHWCYQFLKRKVKSMEIEDGKLKVTTVAGDILYFKQEQ